jgi:pimeloyl-ACP methyl ester carboxylesterase
MHGTISRTVLAVDGIRAPLLEARPAGAATDEAVVFVHGNPGSSQDWVPLLERAGQLARAVAWDHPGFGQADKPAGFDYTVDGYAAHLGRCLDALGIATAHLVGHDFGGPWMLRWAAGQPDRFASATLINTGVLTGYRWHYLARVWRTPILGELFQATSTRPAFRLLLRHGNRPPLPRAFVDRMYDDMDRGTKRAILALYRATDDPGGEPARMLSAALRTASARPPTHCAKTATAEGTNRCAAARPPRHFGHGPRCKVVSTRVPRGRLGRRRMAAARQVGRAPAGCRGLAVRAAADACLGVGVVAVAVAPGLALRGPRGRLRGRQLGVLLGTGPDRAGNKGQVPDRLRAACRERRRPDRAGRAHAVRGRHAA